MILTNNSNTTKTDDSSWYHNRTAKLVRIWMIIMFGAIQAVFVQGFCWLFYPLKTKLPLTFKGLTGFLKANSLRFMIFITETLCPSNIVFTHNESIDSLFDDGRFNLDKKSIVISNHQIYSDWLYIWYITYLAKLHVSLKIILKHGIKKIPVVGSLLVLFDFIFLRREWDKDEKMFTKACENINKSRESSVVLIFPEGTTLHEDTRVVSKRYTDKNNIKKYSHLLAPRALGLFKLVGGLSESIKYVYDFTVAYEGVEPNTTPNDTFSLARMYVDCVSPKKVHIHVRRYKTSELAKMDTAEFEQWLRSIWYEKDELMQQFYTKKSFPSTKKPIENTLSLQCFTEYLYLFLAFMPCLLFMWYFWMC